MKPSKEKRKKSSNDSISFTNYYNSYKFFNPKAPSDLLSDHSDSESHRSEESIHSTDNYHYVKKIIKYRDSPSSPSSNSNKSNEDSSEKPKSKSINYKVYSPSFKPGQKSKKFQESQKKLKKTKKKSGNNEKILLEKVRKKPKREKAKTDPIKDQLINGILRRWWYALDDWPPANFNYADALKKQKLRLVSPDDWSAEANVSHGYTKVMQCPGFIGVYILPNGTVKDLRPQDSCPCYDNLYKKPVKELKEILLTAINCQINQVRELKDHELAAELMAELKEAKSKY